MPARRAAGDHVSGRPRVSRAEGAVVDVSRSAKSVARRRYRFRRRHTPHFYIVTSAISAAGAVCLLNAVAYSDKSVLMAEISFAAVCVTAVIVSAGFFWGFYMIMSGHIPHRLNVLAPHGIVGVLSPLLYSLNISVDLDGLGRLPLSGWSFAASIVGFLLLGVQYTMGKLVVRPEPLRIVKPDHA